MSPTERILRILPFLGAVVFINLVAIIWKGGSNSYTGGFSLADGITSVGDLFGGVVGFFGAVGVVVVIGLVISLMLYLAQKNVVVFVLVALAALITAALIGTNWVHVSVDMLVPVVVVLVIASETALVKVIANRFGS
jgi:hypothetical protein